MAGKNKKTRSAPARPKKIVQNPPSAAIERALRTRLTPTQRRAVDWYLETTGYNPKSASTRQEAFEAGVRIERLMSIWYRKSAAAAEARGFEPVFEEDVSKKGKKSKKAKAVAVPAPVEDLEDDDLDEDEDEGDEDEGDEVEDVDDDLEDEDLDEDDDEEDDEEPPPPPVKRVVRKKTGKARI